MTKVTIIPPTAKKSAETVMSDFVTRRKVAGYARVSTDKDEQFTSYEAQIEYYTRYIQSHADWELVEIYTDEGITGTSTRKRVGFKRMVKDALDGKIDLIVTKSVSRFARNTVDSLTTIRKLKENGIEVFFEKENIRTFDGKGELLLTIMSSLAQEESRSISDNVSWGIKESMRKGKAYVPYSSFLGYDKGENGEMKINPEQAVIVRRIYGMYLQGLSPYRIAQVLMDEKIPSPSGKEKWFTTTVASILKNEKYKGDALRQKTYTKDFLSKEKITNKGEVRQYYISEHHEAIIPPEIFDRVQKELEQRGTSGIKKPGAYLFSQAVKCGDCGTYYGPKTWHPNTSSERVVWICNNKYKKGKECCTTPTFSEEQLKGFFVCAVNKLLADKNLLTAVINTIKEPGICIDGYVAEKYCLQNEIKNVKALIDTCDKANTPQLDEYMSRLRVAELRLLTVQSELAEKKRRKEELDANLQALCTQSGNADMFDPELWYNLARHIVVFSLDDVRVVFKDGTEIKV